VRKFDPEFAVATDCLVASRYDLLLALKNIPPKQLQVFGYRIMILDSDGTGEYANICLN